MNFCKRNIGFCKHIYWMPVITSWLLIILILYVDSFALDKQGHGWFYNYQNIIAGMLTFAGGGFAIIAITRQIRASAKEIWIHDFRKSIVQFLNISVKLNILKEERINILKNIFEHKKRKNFQIKSLQAISNEDDLNKKFKKCEKNIQLAQDEMRLSAYKILLFLDLSNPEHLKLNEVISMFLEKLDVIIETLLNDVNNNSDYNSINESLTDIEIQILDKAKEIINNEIHCL